MDKTPCSPASGSFSGVCNVSLPQPKKRTPEKMKKLKSFLGDVLVSTAFILSVFGLVFLPMFALWVIICIGFNLGGIGGAVFISVVAFLIAIPVVEVAQGRYL